MQDQTKSTPDRDWVLISIPVAVAAVAALWWSWSGLYGLGLQVGGGIASSLYAACPDALAVSAILTAILRPEVRGYAGCLAAFAVLDSFAGNAGYHAIATGELELTWKLTVLISGLPSIQLGLAVHLAVRAGVFDSLRDYLRRRAAEREVAAQPAGPPPAGLDTPDSPKGEPEQGEPVPPDTSIPPPPPDPAAPPVDEKPAPTSPPLPAGKLGEAVSVAMKHHTQHRRLPQPKELALLTQIPQRTCERALKHIRETRHLAKVG